MVDRTGWIPKETGKRKWKNAKKVINQKENTARVEKQQSTCIGPEFYVHNNCFKWTPVNYSS